MERITFGDFVLDLRARSLSRCDVRLRLSPKAFELLALLAQARPRALPKAELQERLWPDTFVVEANLSNLVGEIRAAIGDDRHGARFVRTVHGHGYAFCGDARVSREPAAPRCWLLVGRTPFALGEGEHILGRDDASVVPLCAPTVSRRHARLVVESGRARLFDLGSTNGTWVCGRRVRGDVTVRPGEEIRIGPFYLALGMESVTATTAPAAG
jgi:DNA-binding winged helix-turn-helix (wHTH) protein